MANYDKNIPIASETLRKSQPKIKDNFEAIEDAFGAGHEFETDGEQTGKHLSPVFKDVGEPDAPTGNQEVKLYNDGRILYTIDDESKKRNINKNTDIPSGTKMLFKQSSAPSGWTFKSEDNDKVLLNTSTQGDGGTTGGTWQIPATYHHTLSEGQLPHITGSFRIRKREIGSAVADPQGVISITDAGSKDGFGNSSTDREMQEISINFGNNEGHNHEMPDDWRPSYVKVITCEKD